jgi:hypothetical protein
MKKKKKSKKKRENPRSRSDAVTQHLSLRATGCSIGFLAHTHPDESDASCYMSSQQH